MSQVMVAHVSETQVQDRLRFQRQEGGAYETRADRMAYTGWSKHIQFGGTEIAFEGAMTLVVSRVEQCYWFRRISQVFSVYCWEGKENEVECVQENVKCSDIKAESEREKQFLGGAIFSKESCIIRVLSSSLVQQEKSHHEHEIDVKEAVKESTFERRVLLATPAVQSGVQVSVFIQMVVREISCYAVGLYQLLRQAVKVELRLRGSKEQWQGSLQILDMLYPKIYEHEKMQESAESCRSLARLLKHKKKAQDVIAV
ncbi:hypothetical protein YC2023_085171 [Brassica napus]